MTANAKIKKLRNILKAMDSALVAFSGGTDSSFLVRVAKEEISGRLLAVTGVSKSIPVSEIDQAVSLARKLKVRHRLIADRPPKEFWANPAQRCYYCKKALFSRLKKLAKKEKLKFVIDATNADDPGDYRPGTRAMEELGIGSPLKEAGLTKKEIRAFSRKMGLRTWHKPSMACLASRIPYGERITPEKQEMVGSAEEFIRGLGFDQVRVRLQGKLGRVELEEKDIPVAIKSRRKISRKLKALGFVYAAIDLDGYRMGSHNEVLKWTKKR